MRRGVLGLVAGAVSALAGAGVVTFVLLDQHHAPQPTARQAGSLAPPSTRAPSVTTSTQAKGTSTTVPSARTLVLKRSDPVSIAIPSIGVSSPLLYVGENPDGSIQVPPLFQLPSKAAWYRNSPTPGQLGPSIIEGHIDTYKGPSVFFNLGALQPHKHIYVTLADGTVAVFTVDGVRHYEKATFPTTTVYKNVHFAALRLITCGGAFDPATGSYLGSTVVFASLVSSHPLK